MTEKPGNLSTINQMVTSKSQLERLVTDSGTLERYLLTQVSLNDLGVYYDPDCPLCSSPSRKEVEDAWLEDRNAKEVCASLKARGEPIPLTVVKNHMEFHIDQSYIELRRREYIKRLITLSEMNLDTIQRVDIALSCLHQQIVAVGASEDPTMSQVDLNKKRSEAMCKVVSSMTSLLNLRANMLGEMKEHGEAFTITKEDFERVFAESLQNNTHVEARKAINELLEKFSMAIRKR